MDPFTLNKLEWKAGLKEIPYLATPSKIGLRKSITRTLCDFSVPVLN